jgi:mannitol/fructose-specific phosphotransferase system IIA component (Ntr-type)
MKLIDILEENDIAFNNDLTTKEDILFFLAKQLESNEKEIKGLFGVFKKREAVASTGIGHGIAIPHAICKEFPGIKAKIIICSKGINFEAVDSKPVYIFIGIAANIERQKSYLSLLTNTARIFSGNELLSTILKKDKPKEIIKIIEQQSRL